MRFGAGTTIEHTPTAPSGDLYPGVVQADGKLDVGGNLYAYNAGPPEDYRWQEPGFPPGDWYVRVYESDGTYRVETYDAQMMVAIPIEEGTYSAVAP